MAVTVQQKLESAIRKLESLKGSKDGQTLDPEKRASLRKAVKKVKRAQRKLKVEKAKKAWLETVEANRLKNIQKADEKLAKQKASEDAALESEATSQAEQGD